MIFSVMLPTGFGDEIGLMSILFILLLVYAYYGGHFWRDCIIPNDIGFVLFGLSLLCIYGSGTKDCHLSIVLRSHHHLVSIIPSTIIIR